MRLFLFFITLFSFLSCSEEFYSPEDIYNLIRKGDPTVKAVTVKINKGLVNCQDYKPACDNAFVVQVKGMNVLFLHYSNQEDAYKSAVNIQGFVTRNWAIDDVTGEPILESFMMKYLGARKVH